MKTLILQLIRFYQFALSPWLGNQCRFYPTCSEYAKQAIEDHGSLKGGYYALHRLLRCHPWANGGFDAVPGREAELEQQLAENKQASHHMRPNKGNCNKHD